jgi:hypothetical protein
MATNVSHESTSDGQARGLIVGKLTRKLGVQTVASRGGQCPAISGLTGSRAGSEKREGALTNVSVRSSETVQHLLAGSTRG